MENIATLIAEALATRTPAEDQFINDTMHFAVRRDDRAVGALLERAEILEFDETLMILEAR